MSWRQCLTEVVIMAKAAAKKAEAQAVRTRMDHLARFIAQMQPEEIWGLLDSLFPSLSENDKEDLYGLVVARQREAETEGRSAEDVFADLETERGLVE